MTAGGPRKTKRWMVGAGWWFFNCWLCQSHGGTLVNYRGDSVGISKISETRPPGDFDSCQLPEAALTSDYHRPIPPIPLRHKMASAA
jgi:hypothetical protein